MCVSNIKCMWRWHRHENKKNWVRRGCRCHNKGCVSWDHWHYNKYKSWRKEANWRPRKRKCWRTETDVEDNKENTQKKIECLRRQIVKNLTSIRILTNLTMFLKMKKIPPKKWGYNKLLFFQTLGVFTHFTLHI